MLNRKGARSKQLAADDREAQINSRGVEDTFGCPRCGANTLLGRVGSFWAQVDEQGTDMLLSWQHHESSTELSDERLCTVCGLEFEHGADHEPPTVWVLNHYEIAETLVGLFVVKPQIEALAEVIAAFSVEEVDLVFAAAVHAGGRVESQTDPGTKYELLERVFDAAALPEDLPR